MDNNNTMFRPPVSVLLVEDNEIDVEAVQRAFKKSGIKCPLYSACDGVEALAILRGTDNKAKLTHPWVILLDINMPRMDGLQLLKELRNDTSIKHSIIFMLTTSNRSTDRLLAYEQNVAGYFLKEDLEEFVNMLHAYCNRNEFPEPTKVGLCS